MSGSHDVQNASSKVGNDGSRLPISDIRPAPENPRNHAPAQVRAIARSIKAFGFNAPILIDRERRVVAGHGRLEAAKQLGLALVPVVRLDHLSEAQAKAYQLADNKLTDRSSWNDEKLAVQLKALSELAVDFDLEDTGFELPELDLRIQSLDEADPDEDAFKFASGAATTQPGDLWHLGDHRLYCGSALERASYQALLGSSRAAGVFTDPPYNVKVDGHVCGSGVTKHREFAMAAGEMSPAQFTDFLQGFLSLTREHVVDGAIAFVCMDWRHMSELSAAGATCDLDLLNLCVWVKNNGGMGSLYRSRHELVFVFRKGRTGHTNNVQLGRFGRNRTNVWHYEGANGFDAKSKVRQLHPTVKPIGLVADAQLDATKRGDIILDPFLGSGTTMLAAERTGRCCRGIELDPLYVDTAIGRWQRITGGKARLSSGLSLADAAAARTQAT